MTAGAVELSRMIKPRHLPAGRIEIDANEAERAALASRFGVTAIPALDAIVRFDEDDDVVVAKGILKATIVQPCAITGDPLTYPVAEDFELRFVPAGQAPTYAPDEEIELEAGDLDVVEYDGDSFDLGEAIAQTLALAIDPYRVGPGAEEARKAGHVSSEGASGPFAALAALKSTKGKGD